MKTALVILLVVLILLLALPMAMGMDMHGACPACNSAEKPIALMCAVIFALSVFIVCLSRTRLVLRPERANSVAALRELFRPPRAV